ncbi:MAG: hypothetical protein ACXQT4_02805 [Methanotrichaceae archaeon]
MKLLPMISILLVFLVVGITCNQQLDRYEAGVGEEVTVMLTLGNTGDSALDVSVTPDLPKGIVTTDLGVQSVEISPGTTNRVIYPIKGEEPGSYEVVSQVDFSTETSGTSRRIRCGDERNRMLIVS